MSSKRDQPRIVVDLEKIRHLNTGLGRFSLHLARELLAIQDGRFQPVFLLPAECKEHFCEDSADFVFAADWKKEGFRRLVRPLVQPFLPASDIALWHTTHQTAKYLPLDSRIPVLLTIHDLNFLHDDAGRPCLDRLSARQRRKLGAVQRLVDRSCAIVTDSAYVATEVGKFLHVGARPVYVIPLGLAPPSEPSNQRPKFLPAGPFLLTVGNCVPHKNFHVLLQMIESLPDARLVIAGKKATPYGASIERDVVIRGLSHRVFMPGEVSDGDRQWLYENCDGFLFPSLTEGFGFPVLEAMQCGRPVFVSRTTSLPEIAAEHGFYFDSYEPGTMARVVREGIAHADKTAGFSDALRRHASSYTWKAAAERYAEAYEEVLAFLP